MRIGLAEFNSFIKQEMRVESSLYGWTYLILLCVIKCCMQIGMNN